jgi:hypothetical protein
MGGCGVNGVVVSCGRSKRNHISPAATLYTGRYFTTARTWALSVGWPWLIVSARHGLIRPTSLVAPYDTKVGDAGSITPAAIAAQLPNLTEYPLTTGPVVLVGGQQYARLLAAAGLHVSTPFARFGGMGYQMQALNKHKGTIP